MNVHAHAHVTLDASRRLLGRDATRVDPTGTGAIRQAYERNLVRRFRKVASMARKALVERDVLGLKPKAVEARVQAAEFRSALFPVARDSAVPPRHAFQHSAPADRLDAFSGWLYEIAQEEILGIIPGLPSRMAGRSTWQAQFLSRARRKGEGDAKARIKQAGGTKRRAGDDLALNRKEKIAARERADLIQQRAFGELEGITDATASRVSRVIAQGIEAGRSPAQIARELTRAVEGIGITRARTLARTETIWAYNEAALNEYEEAAIAGVAVEAEFSTSEDDAVCPECEALEGKVFSLDEAHGMIPVHPNCRCAFIPLIPEGGTEAKAPPKEEPGQFNYETAPDDPFMTPKFEGATFDRVQGGNHCGLALDTAEGACCDSIRGN